jgi:vacuolar-type H+-ATPase subunit I/STV1
MEEFQMSIGLGVFLVVVGAILTFAVDASVDFVNLDMVGYILMAGGAVVILLGLVFTLRKRKVSATTRTVNDGNEGLTQTERSVR